MGKAYTQVTMEERCEIACLRSQGSSLRQIAAGVDRPPSTVARELKRNGSRTLGYQPRYANQQAHARRWRGSRPAPGILELGPGVNPQLLEVNSPPC